MCGDDGEGWGGTLTEQQVAELAALDAEGDPLEDGEFWDDPAEFPEFPEDAGAGVGDRPVPEALPWLCERGTGTDGGFGASGVTDSMPPSPALAGLANDKWAAGLARASDDELAGLMIAWRRIASWATAGELAAVGELGRRRWVQVAAGADPHLAEHVADEVALVLTLTGRPADKLVDTAVGLSRLPQTAASLAAGDIDVPRALVILDELTGLDGPHAATVEAAVLGRAGGQTTGELRRSARRAVLAADPGAARIRKEKAEKQARVERWAEAAGTAALAGRDLPAAETLAADAHLTAWAKRLKTAGVDRGLDQLRARVYLALLNGQPPESLLPVTAAGGAGEPAETGTCGMDSESQPAPTPAQPGVGKAAVRGSVNLVLSLATSLGWSDSPGEVAGVRAAGRRRQPGAGRCAGPQSWHPVVPDHHRSQRPGRRARLRPGRAR